MKLWILNPVFGYKAIKGELFGNARIEILSFREARTVGDCLREVPL